MGPNKDVDISIGAYNLTWGFNNLGDECWLVSSSRQMGTLTSFRSQEQAMKWINDHIESDRYDEWFDEVSAITYKHTEMDADELPDWDSRECFDRGMTPAEAAAHAIIEAGGF